MIKPDTTAFSKLTVAAFTAYPWNNVLPKLRLLDPAETLGIQVLRSSEYQTGETFPENIARSDLVFIQRDFPRFEEPFRKVVAAAKSAGKPIVYDIDDLLFETSGFPNKEEADYYLPAVGLILEAIQAADMIFTSSQQLKLHLDPLHHSVHVMPNFLDDRIWRLPEPSPPSEDEPLVIGYVGTRSHVADIESLAPMVEQIDRDFGDRVKFRLWIERPPGLLMRYNNVHWTSFMIPAYTDYTAWMAETQPDIWIAPLLDHPFNRVKSPIKYLEYSAKAIPGIYSDVIPYRSMITHGVNGFLAGTPDEWIESILLLVENPEQRYAIGLAAQKTIRDGFLLSNSANHWGEKLFEATKTGSTPRHPEKTDAILRLMNRHYAALLENLKFLDEQLEQAETKIIDKDDLLFVRAKKLEQVNWSLLGKIENTKKMLLPPGSLHTRAIRRALGVVRKTRAGSVITDLSANNPNRAPELGDPLRLALYTTDNWHTASAHIRLVGPSLHPSARIKILDGCQSSNFPHLEFFIQADAVVIQRDFPRHQDQYLAVLGWARQNGKPVIFEIDDLLYDLPQDHPEKAYFSPVEEQIAAAIRASTAVITSTQPLAKKIRQLNPNTWCLPNYLDEKIWSLNLTQQESKDEHQPIQIGYMGGITQTHMPDIISVNAVLEWILDRFGEKVNIHFWGIIPPGFSEHKSVVFHPEKFPDYLDFAAYFSHQKMDIFLAPLLPGEFNDCKSAIKYLEYSSLAVAGVYSDVYPYREIIRHGINGLLAATTQEWKTSLLQLIESPALRESVGNAALRTVQNQFLLGKHAQEWSRIYKAAIKAGYRPSN